MPAEGVKGGMPKPSYAGRRHGCTVLGQATHTSTGFLTLCRAEGAFVAGVVTRNAYEAKAAAAVSTMA